MKTCWKRISISLLKSNYILGVSAFQEFQMLLPKLLIRIFNVFGVVLVAGAMFCKAQTAGERVNYKEKYLTKTAPLSRVQKFQL